MLILFNLLILGALLILLIMEEARYRALKRRIMENRQSLTGIAHQMRSPITTVLKFSALIGHGHVGKVSPGQKDALEKLDSAVSEIVVMLDRLLGMSRLEEGTVARELKMQDLRRSIEAAVDAIRGMSEERKQVLTFHPPKGAYSVSVDPLLLHGIFDEILLNAVAYTHEKGSITVTMKTADRFYEVFVQDTGIGITEEEKPHIFEKFFRGERAKKMYKAGHGLGLAFAKDYVLRCKGRISFVSKEGKGSVFTIKIPRGRK